MAFGIIVALVLITGAASGLVMCDSLAVGEHVSTAGDYTGTAINGTACDYEATAFHSRLMGRDASYATTFTGVDTQVSHMTDVSLSGMYSDSMLNEQYNGCNTGQGCNKIAACGDEAENQTASRAMFRTSIMAQNITLQSMGDVGRSGMIGQAYATGNGRAVFTASAFDSSMIQDRFTESTFSQRIGTSGRNITAGMSFSWAR